MSERMKFVGRLVSGERMIDLCREFGISRKTGYKIFSRYEAQGVDGLKDQFKGPRNHPNQTKAAIVRAIIEVRKEHPTWGAPKIKSHLETVHGSKIIPARSTIHAILDRNHLIKFRPRRNNKYVAQGTDLISAQAPNKLWCTDFKGQFRLGNGKYCYPLTITDQFSKYLLACESLDSNKEDYCIEVFEQVFERYGLPGIIRSDNGVPFGSHSLFGLSRLSVFWLRQGIRLERIKPGHPEQNGSHERMHRTLKAEATKPASSNILRQQEKFDSFREIYNQKRPHQAIGMSRPADIYQCSKVRYNPIQEALEYPNHDAIRIVNTNGDINHKTRRVYLGIPFVGHNVGLKEIEEKLWKVTFMDYDLGFFDEDSHYLQAGVNPFLIKTE